MRRRAFRCAAAGVLATGVAAGVAGAGSISGTVIERERVDGSRSLGLTISEGSLAELPRGVRSFDEILLLAPRNVLRGGELAHAPEGWRLDARRGRLWGPPVAGLDLRIDYARGWQAPGEVEIDCRSAGRSVYRSTLGVESRPRVTRTADYRDWLELPRTLRAGSPFRIEPLARDKLQLGLRWDFRIDDPHLRFDWRTNDAGQLEAVVPNPYTMGGWSPHYEPLWPWERPYRVVGTDRWGDVWVEAPWKPIFLPLSYGPAVSPRFDAATEIVAPNSQLCVCGHVPDLAEWGRLSLGGRALGAPIVASDASAVFALPSGLGLGEQGIEYQPWASAGRSTGLGTSSIRVDAYVDRADLDVTGMTKPRSTPLTLRIVGTERRFPVLLTNMTPSIIDLSGGPVVSDITSGGPDNKIERTVTGLRHGEFNVAYRVDLPSCPCEAGEEGLAQRVGAETATFFSGCAESAGLMGEGAAPPSGTEPDQPTTLVPMPGLRLPASPYVCQSGAAPLTLLDGRFRVEVEPRSGAAAGGACVRRDTGDSGLFYFFQPDNWEMLLKVLNGCNTNDRYWVFAAATTNVEYTLTVTDTRRGEARTYENPIGRPFQPIQDTSAFATCP